MNWKDIVRNDVRYQNFAILAEPVMFKELFKDQNIPRVQIHATQVIRDYIVGFCGAFEWKNNKMIPLDYDFYSDDLTVLGYKWYVNEKHETNLDILVGTDW